MFFFFILIFFLRFHFGFIFFYIFLRISIYHTLSIFFFFFFLLWVQYFSLLNVMFCLHLDFLKLFQTRTFKLFSLGQKTEMYADFLFFFFCSSCFIIFQAYILILLWDEKIFVLRWDFIVLRKKLLCEICVVVFFFWNFT